MSANSINTYLFNNVIQFYIMLRVFLRKTAAWSKELIFLFRTFRTCVYDAVPTKWSLKLGNFTENKNCRIVFNNNKKKG